MALLRAASESENENSSFALRLTVRAFEVV